MWYVYILECSDKTLYTGITTDLKRRLKEHNASTQGAKYTRGRRPLQLVYSTKMLHKSAAQKEEYRIKKLSKAEKLNIIENVAPNRGQGSEMQCVRRQAMSNKKAPGSQM